MKLLKKTILILIVFLKTGNLLSENNLFNVNNILLEKKDSISSNKLANQAIENAFIKLKNKILLNEDIPKVSDLNFREIRKLVKYYNISKNSEEKNNQINFSVTFDKDKIHNLFYSKGISYSDISDKEFYILPILFKDNEIFIFSNNIFYDNWNNKNKEDLIEFILPTENIELIQIINKSRENLIDLELTNVFKEYSNKNVALAIIEYSVTDEKKIYLKSKIEDKIISKSFILKKNTPEKQNLNKKIIHRIKDEITNLVKSQNLIDVRTPSFLNVKLNLNKKNNLVLLNSKIKKIDLIENIFVQEYNKDYVNLRIKYLGKLEKIINQLKKENINLKFNNDRWLIKIL